MQAIQAFAANPIFSDTPAPTWFEWVRQRALEAGPVEQLVESVAGLAVAAAVDTLSQGIQGTGCFCAAVLCVPVRALGGWRWRVYTFTDAAQHFKAAVQAPVRAVIVILSIPKVIFGDREGVLRGLGPVVNPPPSPPPSPGRGKGDSQLSGDDSQPSSEGSEPSNEGSEPSNEGSEPSNEGSEPSNEGSEPSNDDSQLGGDGPLPGPSGEIVVKYPHPEPITLLGSSNQTPPGLKQTPAQTARELKKGFKLLRNQYNEAVAGDVMKMKENWQDLISGALNYYGAQIQYYLLAKEEKSVDEERFTEKIETLIPERIRGVFEQYQGILLEKGSGLIDSIEDKFQEIKKIYPGQLGFLDLKGKKTEEEGDGPVKKTAAQIAREQKKDLKSKRIAYDEAVADGVERTKEDWQGLILGACDYISAQIAYYELAKSEKSVDDKKFMAKMGTHIPQKLSGIINHYYTIIKKEGNELIEAVENKFEEINKQCSDIPEFLDSKKKQEEADASNIDEKKESKETNSLGDPEPGDGSSKKVKGKKSRSFKKGARNFAKGVKNRMGLGKHESSDPKNGGVAGEAEKAKLALVGDSGSGSGSEEEN